jgi:hypothetical protein
MEGEIMKSERGSILLAAAACVLVIAPTSASAEVNLATGLDAQGNLQYLGGALDANWTVTGAVNPLDAPNAYVVGVNTNESPFDGSFPPWVFNGPNSSWIAANPFDGAGNGDMTFTHTFTVSDPTIASIVGGYWTIDDGGVLALNGVTLASLPAGQWGSMHPFSTVPSDFVAGVNTLTMTIVNSDFWSEGARLEGMFVEGVPPPTIPEPSTWSMMLAGFASLGYAALRRGGRTAPVRA